MADARKRPTRGFTLIELAAVMLIIGILVSLILVAASGGVRRAEQRSTESLLLKLDTGISDRIEALLSASVEPSAGHQEMARVYYNSSDFTKWIEGPQRTAVIAQVDKMRAELPDVFVVVGSGGTYGVDAYPLNFAAQQFTTTNTYVDYLLPLGTLLPQDSTGIYGASYSAAAGIYKNLGYLPAGYDAADNDGDGLVDEYGEGVNTSNSALVTQRLAAHTHKTARSEMLYAILVEGQGPLGSAFNADDFTDREVRDTDGDGLPEFIDAWGEPLQFYRWPIMFHSDLQKGLYSVGTDGSGSPMGPYNGAIDPREQNPLDPNQQLVAPAWWSSTVNVFSGGSAPLSGKAVAFQAHFYTLVEPLSNGTTAAPVSFWDRGATYHQRRAYLSKFLIVSSGPDKELGIAQVGKDYGVTPAPSTPYNNAGVLNVTNVVIENQAAQATLNRTDALYLTPQTDAGNASITTLLQEAGLDDVTNHSIFSAGGGVQ